MISFFVILAGFTACLSISSWLIGFNQMQKVTRQLPIQIQPPTSKEQKDLSRIMKHFLMRLGTRLSVTKAPAISQTITFCKVEIKNSRDWHIWTAIGTLAGFVLGFLTILIDTPFAVISMIFLLFLGTRFPHMILFLTEQQKKKQLSQEFSDFLYIISICMQSGLTFHDSIRFYVDHFSSTIADEFEYVWNQMRLGISQEEAIRQMADRNPSKEFRALIRNWLYAEQLGTPVSTFMSESTNQIRKSSLEMIKERSWKASFKMNLVTGLIFVLSIFILLVTTIF